MGIILVKMDENGRVLDYSTDAVKIDEKRFHALFNKAVDLAKVEILVFKNLGLSDVKSVSINTLDFSLIISRGPRGDLVIVTFRDEATVST